MTKLHHLHLLLNSDYNPVAKECYSCHKMQTLDSYYRDKQGVLGRASACAECRRVSSKQFRQTNTDYYRKYQLANRDYLLAYQRKWAENNTVRQQLYAAKASARRAEALARCLPDDTEYIEQVEAVDYCEVTGETVSLELDHIMPVTKGNWGNTVGNLMKLSASLNSSKGNKNVFDWMGSMEQERLEYLVPQGMTVDQFRQKLKQALTVKAAEKQLSYQDYKEQYELEYNRKPE